MCNNSAININFLRWKYKTHEALTEKLQGIVNWNDLSKFALGDKPIPKSVAKEIESRLGLPEGWLERENLALITLPNKDHALVTNLLSAKPKVREAIGMLLHGLDENI